MGQSDIMNLKVLIVEDERGIADNLIYALETDGFNVQWASTGGEALERLAKSNFDLLILDVGLPDVSGFDLCKQIRQESQIPIFFLTARASEIDRILGLELGADDYITKPFSPREISARIKALFRRMQSVGNGVSENLKESGPFQVDESRYRITYEGTDLELRRYEFGIMKMLLSRPGWVYSRTQIMNEIWDAPDMSLERTVDTHIKSIRRKIARIDDREWIITHRGIGYSFKETK